MNSILLHEVKDKSEILTFNTPEKLNVLSEEMLKELSATLRKCASNQSTHVVILKSTGKAFCAGHDLKQMQNERNNSDKGLKYFNELFRRCGKFMMSIKKLPQPVIASVNGIATAAGCQLVASCDLAVASSDASFGVNGVNIGLFCSTPMVALSRNVAKKHAMEMLLTGDMIDSKNAKAIGLINDHVSKDMLIEETLSIANKIASKSAMTVKMGKQAFYIQSELELSEAYKYTSKIMVENMLKEDAKEGIDAFINKRNPQWTDK